ncbi:MAG TPA: PilN domain-containing protein [Polaromonas sp.]|uniref:PilN domain-containing protein n=1 Tax=Polaromonas sp. TaxID=1869339 RepID=UPI002D695C2B|nr:PilN domain-containing protein [Polaromonas sp.]HYW56296.1 PilN domain-containing protein [Polaromonas sp.]
MILVNLLPHREAARKARREAFFVSLAIAALIGGLICGAVYSWYQTQISAQQGKNTFLKTEITRLENQIKEIAGLQQEITALRARQTAVEDLQGNRNLPVYLLDELVKQLPDGVYVTSMKHENQSVFLTGVAQSNERVSELLRNLGNNSRWLTKPELIEITAKTVALNARDQRRVANFTMRVALQRATDVQKADSSMRSGAHATQGVGKPVPIGPVPAATGTGPAPTSSAPASAGSAKL